MLGALQNCGFEVVYRLGYEDAARTAPAFFSPNPLRIKHQVKDEAALERTHPAYYSLPEQHHEQIQDIYRLPKRHALIRDPDGRVARIRTVPVPDPLVDSKKLKRVKDDYLRWCYRSEAEIEAELERHREAAPKLPQSRSIVRLG